MIKLIGYEIRKLLGHFWVPLLLIGGLIVANYRYVDIYMFAPGNYQYGREFYNEYGGFAKEGKEYTICVNKQQRLPTVWSHILANPSFGTLVTESQGGYTWYKNSRLNRITKWSNNAVVDMPSEALYLQEEETRKTWSLG